MTKHTATATGRAIGYVRVSTDKQAGAGVSLEAQTARIQAMATLQDVTLLEAIGERTRDAMAHKKAHGQRVGTVPFGFQLAADGRMLDPNEIEQRALGIVRELRAGGFTLQQIADELNRQGQQTRRGGAWRHQ